MSIYAQVQKLTHKLNCTTPNLCNMKADLMSSAHICTAVFRRPVIFLE